MRRRHPILGGAILALTDDPPSTKAWATGAAGERVVGRVLDGLAGAGVVALHDRRIPGGHANIDHLAVVPSGVWVIDAKRYCGQVNRRDVAGWFQSDTRLYVGRRDCTRLVTAMARQVAAARAPLHRAGCAVPVRPMLCFVDAGWPLFAKPFGLEGVTVTWPGAMAGLLRRDGPLSTRQIRAAADALAAGLPSAS